jgi:hypothetical protein
MKKSILLFALLFNIVVFPRATACDVCGCGPGAGFTGLLTGQPQNFIGLRSGYQVFNHPNTAYNFNGNSQVLQDQFIRNEFWYRKYLSKKNQLMIQVPFQNHIRSESLRTTSIQGVGDIQVHLMHTLVERDGKRLQSRLLIGSGIGLPTGTYMQRDEQMTLLADRFQIGAGAFSGLARVLGFVERKRLGMFIDMGYRIAGANEQTFQLGNQGTVHLQFYWKAAVKKRLLLPSMGLSLEHFERDKKYNQVVKHSGGTNLLLHAGTDLYTSKWIVQVFAQQVIWHNLPSAMPIPGTRLGVTIARATKGS